MLEYSEATERDLDVMREQLGRPMRGVVGIGARCVCGNPTVVVTRPRLPDGTPFPTLYYLSHPAATIAMSQIEADQIMPEMQQRLSDDDEFGAAYLAAHERYLAERESLEVVEEIAGVTAGGMPTRVKCLHALAAHSLVAGPGVNPVGDWALELSTWSPQRCVCANPGDALTGDAQE
ncbi:DUF501 domain-containing protein [Pseudoclavibacter terrae]|nr:DUF501 domain-containing protein [Pseudoclavibacter terrae]